MPRLSWLKTRPPFLPAPNAPASSTAFALMTALAPVRVIVPVAKRAAAAGCSGGRVAVAIVALAALKLAVPKKAAGNSGVAWPGDAVTPAAPKHLQL